MKLQGKVAIITGGARGIGLAIGQRYASEGARVVVADLDEAECKKTAASIGNGAIGLPVDVTLQESIDRLIAGTLAQASGIDILVNAAAIFDMGPFVEISRESYERVFKVNVEGLVFTMQAVANHMIGQGTGGKIINFSSEAGRRGQSLVSVYCASKAAVISFTQSAGLALARHKINVNAIAPGVIDTPMWDIVDAMFAKQEGRPVGEKKRLVGEAVPYGRMGKPDDITGMALFLASSDSDYIVGQTYNVDGGNILS